MFPAADKPIIDKLCGISEVVSPENKIVNVEINGTH
jgi:hypothetical protein